MALIPLPITLPASVRDRIRAAQRVVAFSGAGVSRESGLDTFRGAGGLWERMRPEELATPQAFRADPTKVWSWYAWRFERASGVRPNPAHEVLARFESVFPSYVVVTQNVDGLHQQAGSTKLLELHGTIRRAHCNRCGTSRPMAEAIAESAQTPPQCPCGGLFRPSVVWFGESLPEAILAAACSAAERCDLFLSVGTSSTVYPAAGLIELAARAGACVIEINPEPTPLSHLADLCLRGPAGEVLPALAVLVEECRVPS